MSRYETVKRVAKNRQYYYKTVDFPNIKPRDDDILLIATSGDRCDLIAHQIYNDSSLWWFVASINGLKTNNILPGTQLRVPRSASAAILK